jgi:hypothetical protein
MRPQHYIPIVLVAFSIAFAANPPGKYVVPLRNGVGVYAKATREVFEAPLFEVGARDRLRIIGSSLDHYRVEDAQGKAGWVEKRVVTVVGRSKSFVFRKAEILAALDDPTPIYILDANDPGDVPFELGRSFAEELRENIDKDTYEKKSGQWTKAPQL